MGSLKSLLAVSEAYPDLKADAAFADLQHQLTATEDRIQAARRFYNNNVRDYNPGCSRCRRNLIARLGGFELREYFQIDAAVEQSAPPRRRRHPGTADRRSRVVRRPARSGLPPLTGLGR